MLFFWFRAVLALLVFTYTATAMTAVHAAFKYNDVSTLVKFRALVQRTRTYKPFGGDVKGAVVPTHNAAAHNDALVKTPSRVLMSYHDDEDAIHMFTLSHDDGILECIWGDGTMTSDNKSQVFYGCRKYYRHSFDLPLTIEASLPPRDTLAWLMQ